ncbi:phosphatase PAP2 family protein [Pseudoalteromonas sp. SSDWG2]|uniref:phosphatase PAP2 family protein n=1 Tax=Pseudoalteromonas sp. SSDWG2 TaxID=3139391 RepID=UPI003BA8F59C
MSASADGMVYLVFAGFLVIQGSAVHLQLLYTLVIAFGIERPLYYVSKNLIQRTRPCDALICGAYIKPNDKFSLPSGHSAAAWAFAVAVGHFYPNFESLLYIWAGSVACSRVLLGVHYPLDTLVGSLFGACCALSALLILEVV